MSKSEKYILILAVIVRFLIMPFFYHPDMKTQNFHFQFFSKGIFNIYDYVAQNKNSLPYQDTFNYLPLTYYTFGITQTLTKPFLGNNFSLWINNWGDNQNSDPNIPFYLTLLKIPYLLLDLGLGWLLYKQYKNKKILMLWYFNPISLYLIYVLGNFDILPTFLTFLSFYLIKKEKINWAYLSIGVAIALKIYPILFLPFLMFYKKEKFLSFFKNGLISISPLAVSLTPFIFQKSFYDAFLGSGLTQKLLEFRIQNIPIFPVFYIFIFIYFILSKSKLKFEKSIFFIFLIFIGLVNFHPQWILWFLPFVLLTFNNQTKFNIFLPLFFILVFTYILLFNDNYLFWGHLIPIDPNFLTVTSPFQIIKLKTHFDPINIQNNIHSILLFSGILGIILYAKEK